eukprot:gene23847-biopygen11864
MSCEDDAAPGPACPPSGAAARHIAPLVERVTGILLQSSVPHTLLWGERLRTRPECARFFKIIRVGRVRDACAAMSPCVAHADCDAASELACFLA